MSQPALLQPTPIQKVLGRLSLRLKLMLGYAIVFALTVLLGGAGVYYAAQRALTASLDTTLRETASVAQASIDQHEDEERDGEVPEPADFNSELKPSGDLSIELLSSGGSVLARAGKQEDSLDQRYPVIPGFSTEDSRRVLTLRVDDLYLRVSRPTDTLSGFLETLAQLLLVGSVFMIAVACGAGYWLANRALKPVDAVARTAESIAARGDYAERVPQSPGTDEMARLTRTVNLMLDGLAGTIEREKDFARTAAHELRTPLTVLRGRLDLALERPREAAEYQKALTGMVGRVEALTALTEGLLALARTDAPNELEEVELAGVAAQVAESCEDMARAGDKHIRLDLEPGWVQAEGEGVQRAIRNLLENALKYGSGQEVVLKVAAHRLEVTSGGPGPDPAQWSRLLQPFERGAGVQGVSGSGLGLALVSALARRWNARLVPEWGEGTFSVALVFPVADPRPESLLVR
ncbi:sensor histidine kinase [Deinococcus marmoris]|uniref:histidine kinase n=1 Tax=Deinococcus marmoris TaxID=249408 RepID=A0A1U7NTM5_9DEIO|nr:ATP-binding protein [Deinococcus marmoris]OLV16278.1 periplasmic sensor signal transduction histidine kinase [Deinococcus marmoris]